MSTATATLPRGLVIAWAGLGDGVTRAVAVEHVEVPRDREAGS
ncbi:hypothetical protein [Actinophytocola sp.]|nr:hypothetical protein [Actinophytocola sp.]HYQ69242.1 hypothetical protein [Actinophytocola sp.]